MGTPKEGLDWGGATLLEHTVRTLSRAVGGPVVAVGSPGRGLPPLPPGVETAVDAVEGRGPLAGLVAGLRAIETRADLAFVAAVDLPLLREELVRHVARACGPGHDAAVPRALGRAHPLAAAYRVGVRPVAEELLAGGRGRVLDLLEEVRVRWLDEHDLLADPALAAADPRLESLTNLNSPADYDAALALSPSSKRPRSG